MQSYMNHLREVRLIIIISIKLPDSQDYIEGMKVGAAIKRLSQTAFKNAMSFNLLF